jgi:hypothetical protein
MKLAKLVIASIMITGVANQVHAAESCVPVEAIIRSQVQSELSLRSIKIIQMARALNWEHNPELQKYVADSVRVSGGIGHRGLPLPPGLAALHALANSIDAKEFRSTGWDYMDGPYDGCARQDIQIELFNRTSGKLWPIRIEFVNGKVVCRLQCGRHISAETGCSSTMLVIQCRWWLTG